MLDYNHMIGVKMLGEMLPNEANWVTLAGELDQYGLRVARITYAWGGTTGLSSFTRSSR